MTSFLLALSNPYLIAIGLIIVLFLIGRIIRWWNLPKVAEARVKRAKVRQENRTERLRIRRNRK